MYYFVDVGTWEFGRTFKLQARSPRHAYALGQLRCGPTDEVVQIRQGDKRGRGWWSGRARRCVYDYINGFALYERRVNGEEAKVSEEGPAGLAR